jgi:hypothetical protein
MKGYKSTQNKTGTNKIDTLNTLDTVGLYKKNTFCGFLHEYGDLLKN